MVHVISVICLFLASFLFNCVSGLNCYQSLLRCSSEYKAKMEQEGYSDLLFCRYVEKNNKCGMELEKNGTCQNFQKQGGHYFENQMAAEGKFCQDKNIPWKNVCPPDYNYENLDATTDVCYKLMPEKKNWWDALFHCIGLGTGYHLFQPLNPLLDNLLRSKLQENRAKCEAFGMIKSPVAGFLYYTDCSFPGNKYDWHPQLEEITYSNFLPNEPVCNDAETMSLIGSREFGIETVLFEDGRWGWATTYFGRDIKVPVNCYFCQAPAWSF